MLRFLRKYSSSVGIKILYGILAALFVIWGVGAVGGERVDVVANVHGETITRQELDRVAAQLQRRYEEMLRGRWTSEMARTLDLRGQALDQLVQQALMQKEAERLGVTVTDEEVVETIVRMPELQDGGRFNRDRLEAFLRNQRDRGEFEDELKRNLLMQRVETIVTDGVQVADAEVEQRYRLDHDQATVAFARVTAADLAKDVAAPTDAELQEYLEQHADRYRKATEVRARYVAYRPDDFAGEVKPTDGEIAEYYELHKDERFTEPEQVRARHILVKAPADAEAKAAARKKASDLLARVKAGGDFAALAKQSDDPGSAANGGDLGLFPRGRMTPAFEKAAFDLAPGTVSDLVETPFGFHVIKVEEHREGGTKPLDAVRDEIVATLGKERSFELARKQAEADRRKLARGTAFAEAVAPRPVQETPPFGTGADVPGVGPVADFTDTALTLRENEASDLIETENAIYLLTPFARVEAHTPPLDEIRDRVADDVRRERTVAAAKERGEKLLARAKEIGLEKAAAEMGMKVEETEPFDRLTVAVPKIGPLADLRADAFTLTADAPLAPKVYAAGGGDAVVMALRSRIPADMSGLDAAKADLRKLILQQKRQAVLAAYVDHLKERASREGALEIYGDKLARG
ncbi:MAG TPA: SurA N-terminal domain-containing protein [Candidatus Binatia bacterium]|nr:SurA N-terminal domain-containing protein [Candidatus Binatia bacterium]